MVAELEQFINDQQLAQSQWFELIDTVAMLAMPCSDGLRALKLRSLAAARPAVLTIGTTDVALLTVDDRFAIERIHQMARKRHRTAPL